MALTSRRRRIYDWAKDCPKLFSRQFPPIVGEGRGCTLEEAQRRSGACKFALYDEFDTQALDPQRQSLVGGSWVPSPAAVAVVEPDEQAFYAGDFIRKMVEDYGLEVTSTSRHDPDAPGSFHSPQPEHLDREAHNRLH